MVVLVRAIRRPFIFVAAEAILAVGAVQFSYHLGQGDDATECPHVDCNFVGPFIEALSADPRSETKLLEARDLKSCLQRCLGSDWCLAAQYSPASHFLSPNPPQCRLHEKPLSRTGNFASIPQFDFYIRKKPGLDHEKRVAEMLSVPSKPTGDVSGTSLHSWIAVELPKIPKAYMDPLALVLDTPGLVPHNALIVETGVFRGRTINQIARKRPQSKIFGLDSFEGLPQDWHFDSARNRTISKGLFNLNGNLPAVESNVHLIKGWFNESLSHLVADAAVSNRSRIDLLHIDCDLYSSTSQVLTQLSDRLQPGTVLVFDDMINYGDFDEGEFKAFYEFLRARSDLGAEWLGSACGAQASGFLEGDGTCLAAALRLTRAVTKNMA